MPDLLDALSEYDGKHVDVLEEIRDEFEPSAVIMRQAIALVPHEDVAIAKGATWVLRAWVEDDAAFGAALVKRLAAQLPKMADPWARLHVCQTVRSLTIPAAQAAAFAEFLESCRVDRHPFLRAWATDGLHHLGLSHPKFAKAARRAMECGLVDTAPSVRARVRRIIAGD